MDQNPSAQLAVVTGATSGIGKEIARGLVRQGLNVVVTARDVARGEVARRELATAGSGSVSVLPLDVADLGSVRSFAAAFADRHDRLDVLVNNAGAWFTDRRESPDGYELTFATNVLGPHLLTELVRARLLAAPAARVVNLVSSITGNYDPADLQYTRRPYDGFKAYAQSKQALTMLTWSLAGQFAGGPATANTAAPGFVRSGFNRNARGPRATMIGLSVRLFGVSAVKGADTPLWAATAPELAGVSGQSFAGRKQQPPKYTEPAAIAQLVSLVTELEQAARR